jgi:hypothetical protein
MGSLGMGKIKIGGNDGLFSGIEQLETHEFDFGDAKKEIVGSFQGIGSLNEVVLGKSITDMETVVKEGNVQVANTFKNCKNLKSLVITNEEGVIPLHPTADNSKG